MNNFLLDLIFSYLYWLILFLSIYFVPVFFVIFLKGFFKRFLLSKKEIIKKSRYLLFFVLLILLMLLVISPNTLFKDSLGNFWLHFIGGGFTVAGIYIYWLQCIKYKIDEFLQWFFLYFIVSGSGVANEMLEFLLDTIFKLDFTSSRTDTWKDLLANTLGAFCFWAIYKIYHKLVKPTILKK